MAEENNVFNTTSLICTLDFQPQTDEAFKVDGRKHTHTHRQVPRIELGKLWKLKAEVVPVVVGALGTIPQNLKFYLKKIDILIITLCLQKTVIPGTAFILRRVLGISVLR